MIDNTTKLDHSRSMQETGTTPKFIPGKTRIKYGGAVIDDQEIKAIKSVLDRNWWVLDKEAAAFEKELAKASQTKYALFTNSGSSALMLAAAALAAKIGKGGRVLVPATNFPTAVSALLAQGLKPVLVDVNLSTFCINENAIESFKGKADAMLVVNIAGNIPDLDRLLKVARHMKWYTVLDNCDGFGGSWRGKPVESYFNFSATSFHAAHIITTGEGGAFFCNDRQSYDIARSVREWGRADDTDNDKRNKKIGLPSDYPGRYTYLTIGYNMKPLELQAAMGRVQLKKLGWIKKMREINYNYFKDELEQRGITGVSIIEPVKGASPSWFAIPLMCSFDDRPKLRAFLEAHNVETRVIFAGNIAKQPAYREYFKRETKLPVADMVMSHGFFISAHPTTSIDMYSYVIDLLEEFFQ